ncbi:MAG TPA: cyclase family protein [Miltoncostaeaceae bacterium]|nr:cyclase family protein [Miltoncostaeaceae bacterium]
MTTGTLHDLSRPIHDDMEVHPGDPGVAVARVRAIGEGDPANVSELRCGVHTGTHVDAPVHFLDGAEGVETLPLDALMGPAEVVDARSVQEVLGAPALHGLLPDAGADRVLIATGGGVGLDAEAARLLVSRGVRLVGIDGLSIGGPEAHEVLLGAGVVVLEGLRLDGVPPGRHRLTCLPLLIPGADGAPARAVLEIGAS